MRTLIVVLLLAVCSPCIAQDKAKIAENKAKLEARREAAKKSAETRLRISNAQRLGLPPLPQLPPAPPALPQAAPPVPLAPVSPRVYQTRNYFGEPTGTIVTDGQTIRRYNFFGEQTSQGMYYNGGLQMFNSFGEPTRSIVPLR